MLSRYGERRVCWGVREVDGDGADVDEAKAGALPLNLDFEFDRARVLLLDVGSSRISSSSFLKATIPGLYTME